MDRALIVVDVQKAIDHPKWGIRNNVQAEHQMAALLAHWRKHGGPIVHIQHSSKEPNSPYRAGQSLHDFKDEVTPLQGEFVVEKSTNNAFVDTELSAHLVELGIHELVICGVLTQHSVDCTARMAASLGFEVTVVADATAATEVVDFSGKRQSADDVHNMVLAHLAADYAEIKTTEELCEE